MRLILASSSKNRQNIFKNIGWKYDVVKSTVEEYRLCRKSILSDLIRKLHIQTVRVFSRRVGRFLKQLYSSIYLHYIV